MSSSVSSMPLRIFLDFFVWVSPVAGEVRGVFHGAVVVPNHQAVFIGSSVNNGVGFVPKLWTIPEGCIRRVCLYWSGQVRLM